MMTREGLMVALGAIVGGGVKIGLYVNALAGEGVKLSDIEQAPGIALIEVSGWRENEKAGQIEATSRYTFKSPGNVGLIRGYYMQARGKVLYYQPFQQPVPFMTNEDVMHIRPRLRAKPMEMV